MTKCPMHHIWSSEVPGVVLIFIGGLAAQASFGWGLWGFWAARGDWLQCCKLLVLALTSEATPMHGDCCHQGCAGGLSKTCCVARAAKPVRFSAICLRFRYQRCIQYRFAVSLVFMWDRITWSPQVLNQIYCSRYIIVCTAEIVPSIQVAGTGREWACLLCGACMNR